ncbi:MAG: hypothetical protein R2822_11295 [Spirosomataceae bacterium]
MSSHGQYHHHAKSFWGYNLTLTQAKVTGQIEIKGQYFPDYTTSIPEDRGLGIATDFTVRHELYALRHVEVRLAARSVMMFSDIGTPNVAYLPGSGVRVYNQIYNRKLTLSGGMTIQLFYLIKRVPKRISSN